MINLSLNIIIAFNYISKIYKQIKKNKGQYLFIIYLLFLEVGLKVYMQTCQFVQQPPKYPHLTDMGMTFSHITFIVR